VASSDLADRARRLIEVGIGQGDLLVLDELMAADIVEHQRGNREGRDGAKQVARTLHTWPATSCGPATGRVASTPAP